MSETMDTVARAGSATEGRSRRASASRSLLLTLLGTYVHQRQGRVWSGGLVSLLRELDVEPGATRVALGRLAQRGLLLPSKSGRLVFYALTAQGVALLEQGDQRIFSFGSDTDAPASWTVVWHALPDGLRVERAQVGRRLRFLGFGSVQDGVWLAPHDREREVGVLARELGIAGYVTILIARAGTTLSLQPLVSRAWDQEALRSELDHFVTTFSPLTARGVAREDGEAFVARTLATDAFRRIPPLDPELPDELLPIDAVRQRARSLFTEIYESLRAPAERYFDASVDPGQTR